jgi:hypothetical protein
MKMDIVAGGIEDFKGIRPHLYTIFECLCQFR